MCSVELSMKKLNNLGTWLLYFDCLQVSVQCLFPECHVLALKCVVVVFSGHPHSLDAFKSGNKG